MITIHYGANSKLSTDDVAAVAIEMGTLEPVEVVCESSTDIPAMTKSISAGKPATYYMEHPDGAILAVYELKGTEVRMLVKNPRGR